MICGSQTVSPCEERKEGLVCNKKGLRIAPGVDLAKGGGGGAGVYTRGSRGLTLCFCGAPLAAKSLN